MSAAVNPKRMLWAPDRPKSVDPALVARTSTSTSSSRPPFSSFSSFSSSLSSSLSSAFGGNRHGRPASTASSASAANSSSSAIRTDPTRPASAAPHAQTKWHPRNPSSGPAPTPHTSTSSRSRHRSTSSASAAAAALGAGAGASEAPPPPVPALPDSLATGGSSPSPSPSSDKDDDDDDDDDDGWRASIEKAAVARFRSRARAIDAELQERLRAVLAAGGVNGATISRSRRNSAGGSPPGSADGGQGGGRRMTEEQRLRARHERTMAALVKELEEEVRAAMTREEARRRGERSEDGENGSRGRQRESVQEKSNERGVLVEDESEEWLWRPEELGHGLEKDKGKWKDAVRQEQQVIWDAIKRGGSTPPAVSAASAAASAAQLVSSSAGRKVHFAPSTPAAAAGRTDSPAPISCNVPALPRTPHTPYVSPSALNPHGPARPLSAYPSSHGAGRPLSPAVAMHTRPGSARPASPAHAYARWIPSASQLSQSASVQGAQAPAHARTASIPIPGRGGAASSAGAYAAQLGEGSAGSGSTRSGRSVSASGSWRDWSAGAGGGVGGVVGSAPRRAVTPGVGAVSSASGYASRQRTVAAPQGHTMGSGGMGRAPRAMGEGRYRDREEEEEEGRMVVDDREPDECRARAQEAMGRIHAVSRTGSGRSALPEEDARPARGESPPLVSSGVVAGGKRVDKGKGKARASPSPVLGGGGAGAGMYAAQLEDFASVLRRDLGISAEA